MKSLYRTCFRLRAYLTSFPVILAIFIFFHSTEYDIVVWPVGVSVFLLGFAVRLWSQQHLHFRMDIRKHMTTTGPYALMRNPIYIGNSLMAAGAVVTSELLWLAPATLIWCLVVYHLAVRFEEDYLVEKFGKDYTDYADKTPRWFPRRLSSSGLQLVNKYFFKALLKEAHCFLMLVPFVLKELLQK